GDLKAYVIINGRIQSLTFHIPKKVYLEYKSETGPEPIIENGEVTKAMELLPSGQQSDNLYKVVIPEPGFAREMAKTDGLFSNSNIAGVYESQIQSS
ncbi:hypothetical protein WICPIJ_001848, partial [Wickerhamomyces pijperi]